MSRKKGDAKPGRRTKWSEEQHQFLMSHVAAYLETTKKDKAVFWHMVFPLWFARFPTDNGVPPSSLWVTNNENANDDNDTTVEVPKNGKKKTMEQMSPDEAAVQVCSP